MAKNKTITKSKKGRLSKKLKTDQKENIPKKNKQKINQTNKKSIGTIAMSKQLQLQVKANKSLEHGKHKSKRVCSKRRDMPSLADLEKLFEDTDDDENTVTVDTPQKNTTLYCDSYKSSISAKNNTINKLLPTEDTERIQKQQNTSNINTKFMENTTLIKQIDDDDKNIDTNSSDSNETIEYNLLPDTTFFPSPGISTENKTSIKPIQEDIDTNSSDGNKIIEHNLLPDLFPLPSTSRDYNTFVKNDVLFQKSLRQNPPYSNDNIVEQSNAKKCSDNSCHSVLDDINSNKSKDSDDDDCMIIDSGIVPIPLKSEPTEIIDLQNISNEPNIRLHSDQVLAIDDEIIDVDALIAENQSMVKKYQEFQTNINATCRIVDVTDKTDSSIKQESQPADTAKNTIRNYENDQSGVVFVSESSSQNSRSNKNHQLNKIYRNQGRNSHNQSSFPDEDICRIETIISAKSNDLVHTNFYNDVQKNHSQIWLPQMWLHQKPINSENNLHMRDSPPEIVNIQMPDAKKKLPTRCINMSIQDSPNMKTPNKLPTEPTKNFGDCPICIESLSSKPMVSTICGHVFCMECLNLSIRNSKRCPTCRKTLKGKSSYHQIFL